mgnify:FL=1
MSDTLITAPSWFRGAHHARIAAETRTRAGELGWTIELACDPYTRWDVTEWDAYLPGDAGYPPHITCPTCRQENPMGNTYDQAAATTVLKTVGPRTAADLAKALHWSRTRVRTTLAILEQAGDVRHNTDRTWELTR